MESFKHVSNTWLLAQLIHPFIFYGFMAIADGWTDFTYIVLLVVFSFLFSLGGYVLCIFSFHLISRINLSISQKFFFWLVAMMLCIGAGLYLTCVLLFESQLFMEIIFLIVPGMIAAVIAACIRFKQFVSTIHFLSEESLNANPL